MTILSPNDIRALELPDAKDNFVKIVFLVCSFRILSIDSYISDGILFFLDGANFEAVGSVLCAVANASVAVDASIALDAVDHVTLWQNELHPL